MITGAQSEKIQKAYRNGTLKVQSVSPQGTVSWERVLDVIRNEVPWERIVELTTPYGTKVFTGGHKIYVTPEEKRKAEDFRVGDFVVAVVGEQILYVPILGIQDKSPRQFMYDMTVDRWANFVSGRILLKNSPDKFYHFRPPEFEGNVGRYNRVFGQIWEDAELLEYCERALDWFNMFPPFTGNNVPTIDRLVTDMPAWRTAILWGAISHACFALSANWVADEFDYSIGGVSLNIDKSSKYESLKQNSESQFDKATEAKARTVKYVRGLQQPKYGMGVRSSFGPNVGRGVLSPRSFM